MNNKIQNAIVVALIWLLWKVLNFNLSAAPLDSVEFTTVLVLLLTFLLEKERKSYFRNIKQLIFLLHDALTVFIIKERTDMRYAKNKLSVK